MILEREFVKAMAREKDAAKRGKELQKKNEFDAAKKELEKKYELYADVKRKVDEKNKNHRNISKEDPDEKLSIKKVMEDLKDLQKRFPNKK